MKRGFTVWLADGVSPWAGSASTQPSTAYNKILNVHNVTKIFGILKVIFLILTRLSRGLLCAAASYAAGTVVALLTAVDDFKLTAATALELSAVALTAATERELVGIAAAGGR